MKFKRSFTYITCALVTAVASAAVDEGDSNSKQLQVYPKNLARQHLGANLLAYNPTNQTYVPTEAAAAWLDDDVATGWPTSKGKSYYLLALPEPELMTNFSVSSRNTTGTVNLYASDELATPSAKSWNPIAKNVSIEAINDKKMEKPFSKFAKYLLIETDLNEAGPLYSLYLFGERSAVSYNLQKRGQSADMRSLLGPFTNPKTSINLSSLYSSARVTQSNPSNGYVAAQQAVDDNPESEVSIAPSTTQPGLIIKYGTLQAVGRISVLTDDSTKGKLDFFMVNSGVAKAPKAQTANASADESQYIKASNVEQSASESNAGASAENVSLDGMTPVATVTFDGSNPRASIDFPTATGSDLVARWTPATPNQTLKVREIDSFGAVSMNDYELKPDQIGELGADNSKDGKDYKGGDGKQPQPAIGELDPVKSPYIPGLSRVPENLPLSN